jgi:hypothetical protein
VLNFSCKTEGLILTHLKTSHSEAPSMKRHHIVGIITGICAIGLAVRSALSAGIIDALINFIVLLGLAIITFFKDRLPPRWSQGRLPLWICVIVVCLFLFELIVHILLS